TIQGWSSLRNEMVATLSDEVNFVREGRDHQKRHIFVGQAAPEGQSMTGMGSSGGGPIGSSGGAGIGSTTVGWSVPGWSAPGWSALGLGVDDWAARTSSMGRS